jgi:hypothetical protein
MFVSSISWQNAGHMASRTELRLWDVWTELYKAHNTGKKGLLFSRCSHGSRKFVTLTSPGSTKTVLWDVRPCCEQRNCNRGAANWQTLYARNIPNAVCAGPPKDGKVTLETCRRPWFSINCTKRASRWFNHTVGGVVFTTSDHKDRRGETANNGAGKLVNYGPVLHWSSRCIHVIVKLNPRSLAGASICVAVMEDNSIVPLTVTNLVMWICRYTAL